MSAPIIVIPCYNEAARLDVGRFGEFCASHPGIRFLFVNDGSTDRTRQILDEMKASHAGALEVLHLPRNSGKAEAVRQGLLRACEEGAEVSGFWDADLATPLDAIPEFLELLRSRPDIEMVFGSRVNLLGRKVRRNLLRHYIGRIFATAASGVLRLPIYDTQCGAKLFRVTPDFAELVRQPFLSRWIFDVEIIARLGKARRGADRPSPRDVIYEHPLAEWKDVRGSKLKPGDFFVVAADLVRIWWRYMSR